MPLYLQGIKGVSPPLAGLQLTPMMGGVLVTSIASGQIISRIGRYRLFPIVGTAVMTIGLGRREHRWEAYRRIAASIGVALRPDEIWLLIQICRQRLPLEPARIADRFSVARDVLETVADRLVAQGLATRATEHRLLPSDGGHRMYERIVAGYRRRLAQLLERWSPQEHAEVRATLNAFARALVGELPLPP